MDTLGARFSLLSHPTIFFQKPFPKLDEFNLVVAVAVLDHELQPLDLTSESRHPL